MGLAVIGKGNTQVDGGGHQEGGDDDDQGHAHRAMLPGKEQRRRIFTEQNDAVHCQHQGQLLQGPPAVMLEQKVWSDDRKPDHDAKVACMGEALEEAVCREPDIVEGHLRPGKPQDTKESDVRREL